MASSTIDSAVFSALFATETMKDIFSDRNLVQKWLDTEAALAQAQGELGIIPAEAAREIVANAKAELLAPYTQIGENFKSSITIVPLLKEFKKVLKDNAGEYVHWGATSQDIVDTGLILRMREAHARISDMVGKCEQAAKVQARKYRDVVECGCTHVQHALPITFGLKVASWAFELSRHVQRLEEMKPRL